MHLPECKSNLQITLLLHLKVKSAFFKSGLFNLIFDFNYDILYLPPGDNQCLLFCYPYGGELFYYFGKAKDGTQCSKEPHGVCVRGRCKVIRKGK